MSEQLKNKIRDVYDFPKKGIVFKDITTLLKDAKQYQNMINALYEKVKDLNVDYIVAIESRGYLLSAPLAYKMGVGLVIVRKPGKLPAEVESVEYDLEYGIDKLEVHKDAIEKDKKVLIVDDLLATGGTVSAVCDLVCKVGAQVSGSLFLSELKSLSGREKLSGKTEVLSLIEY